MPAGMRPVPRERLHSLPAALGGKTALVTGHTGFKGGWLSAWLKLLGAKVVGYSLPPAADRPSLFERARIAEGMTSILGDIRDLPALSSAFSAHRPEIVFHLAAQPLVLRSYQDPVETFSTNVQGTVNVLEAARRTPSVRAVVIVTSDKCYREQAKARPYREDDPLGGGRDPYSASKAAAEIATAAYRNAYFSRQGNGARSVGVATARAGNVIGGGDWAQYRIVPDCMRALSEGLKVVVRNPKMVRPWQHVLEPTSGYLRLAALLLEDPSRFSQAWNFGPAKAAPVSVLALVRQVLKIWGADASQAVVEQDPHAPHEAAMLRLDSSKAAKELGWRTIYSVPEAVRETTAWYRSLADPSVDGAAFTRDQIEAYVRRAEDERIGWTCSPARTMRQKVSTGKRET